MFLDASLGVIYFDLTDLRLFCHSHLCFIKKFTYDELHTIKSRALKNFSAPTTSDTIFLLERPAKTSHIKLGENCGKK